jgi:glycerol kinase
MSTTGSEPSNKQIFDLLMSLQQNHQKLEQRLDDFEKRGPPSPSGFEVVSSNDWHADAADTSAEFIGAIDQGTTSSRFLIFSKDGEPVAMHQMEFKQIYPNSGCVTSVELILIYAEISQVARA